jgi:uncharacterized protein YbjT (DUF2867 family)
MAQVFVAGGTGYIGVPLVSLLLARGQKVFALARPGSEGKLPAGGIAVIGDALKPGGYSVPSVCDTFVHLVGVAHPSPAKANEFLSVDQRSLEVAVEGAKRAAIRHFVYVSVAHPAPTMKAYITVRSHCEEVIRAAGLDATFVRPWYVLGPGHRWPYVLKPLYWLCEKIPSKRETAMRLGLVTREQMVRCLAAAVESPAHGVRIIEVPEIRSSTLTGATTES